MKRPPDIIVDGMLRSYLNYEEDRVVVDVYFQSKWRRVIREDFKYFYFHMMDVVWKFSKDTHEFQYHGRQRVD